jgi:hypothetical protein
VCSALHAEGRGSLGAVLQGAMLRAHTRPASSANLQLLTLLGGESVHWLWLVAARALISDDTGITHVFWWSGGAQACFCTSPTACAVR